MEHNKLISPLIKDCNLSMILFWVAMRSFKQRSICQFYFVLLYLQSAVYFAQLLINIKMFRTASIELFFASKSSFATNN